MVKEDPLSELGAGRSSDLEGEMRIAPRHDRLAGADRPVLVLAGFLALVFCTATAEYLVAGLLPQVAGDLGVSIPTAGQTVTAYAVTVAVAGIAVSLVTARLPRKGLALGLAALFVVGTMVSGLAPSFPVLLIGRVVAASSQTTLFAIALVVATQVVAPDRVGRAIATVVSGLTVATLLGVPLGALLGQVWGWRAPFAMVAALAVVGAALIAGGMARRPAPTSGARDELRVLRRRPVWLAVLTTAVGFAGVGTVFTYLVPLLTSVTGFAPGLVSGLLLAFGAGGFVGNLIAGRLTDTRPAATLRGVFAVLVVVLGVMPLAVASPITAVAGVIGLGLCSTAAIAPLQSLLLRHAGDAPTLAVAANVGAFNLANAIGAVVGGLVVADGLLQVTGWFGAVLAAAGFVLAGAALRASISHAGAPN